MKKITKPAEKEEATYFTDFKGKSCGEFGSPVELTLSFNYGSKYDGDILHLHLDDDETELIINVIKQNISTDYKKQLKEKLKGLESSYEASMQSRDWYDCEMKLNSLSLIENILSYKE